MLHHETAGAGPDVVLLHAGVADLRMWDGVVRELQDEARCTACDLRGFGGSLVGTTPYSHAADVAGLIAELGLVRPLVVGASFGGEVALRVAGAAGLVLLDSSWDWEFGPEVRGFGEREDELLDAGRVDEAVALNVAMWAPVGWEDYVRTAQARAFELQLGAAVRSDWPAVDITAIEVPVAVGYGTRDKTDFVAIAHHLASTIPGASLTAFDGAGHLPALEEPQAVARLIQETLGRITA